MATLTTGNPNVDAAIAAGLAIAGPLAAANPYVAAGSVLVTEGLRFWTEFQARNARGETTLQDLEDAVNRVDMKLVAFAQHIADAEAAGKGAPG